MKLLALAVLLLFGCGAVEDIDADAMRAALDSELAHHDGLGLYVYDVTTNGTRVRVLTQLDEAQTAEADAICNLTTVAAYGSLDVSGVDVAAAGGRNISSCKPF
jgi:hypothetical protein